MKKTLGIIIFFQALVATLGSLYYGWFGDPVTNLATGEFFVRANGLTPCEMCWFARILMYPIVIIVLVGWIRKKAFDYASVLVLSGIGIVLEAYQYWYQMTHSQSQIKSVICGVSPEASCAATDIMYYGFITIPFLCLVAFVIIFVATCLLRKQVKNRS